MMSRGLILWLFMSVISLSLIGCSTTAVSPEVTVEAHPDAITMPYRISSAGRILLDISVNENEPQAFVLDTGANVSVIYDSYSEAIGLSPKGETVLIRGLVAVGRRPVLQNVNFEIGGKSFQPDRVAVLETPATTDESIGLLGTDILSDYVAIFNKDTMTATLLPSDVVSSKLFSGWRHMPLEGQTKGKENVGLHFAETVFGKKRIPVLIDTGSNSNFINWRLATLDRSVKRLERHLRNKGHLQGALETTPLKMNTKLFSLTIGQKFWPEVDVTVIELDQLSTVAPVERPMMIAGASMFTPSSLAFDFGGDQIYVRPNKGEIRPPTHEHHYVPSGITGKN